LKNLKKGFTIIELLIVIAIIGILAGTVAPKLIKEIRKATVAKVQHNLGVIRSRLSLDKTLLDEFPNLYDETNTNLLSAYSIEPTPGFTDRSKVSHKATSKVVETRSDDGGWYYIRSTGEIFANLPNGAYTKDSEYEIWNGEDEEIVDDEGTVEDNDTDDEATEDNSGTDWDDISSEALEGVSNFVGGSGDVYIDPNSSTGEYVVDIKPNIGWLSNFVEDAELTGNYFVYIDDVLVNSGEGTVTSNGEAMSTTSYRQKTGGNSSNNLKVAFEYIKDGETKIIYGQISLTNQ